MFSSRQKKRELSCTGRVLAFLTTNGKAKVKSFGERGRLPRGSHDCLTPRGQRHVAAFQALDTNSVKSNNFLMFGKIKTKGPLNTMFEVHFTHRNRVPEHSVLGGSQLGVRKQPAPRGQSPKRGLSERSHRQCAKKVA